MFVVEPKEKKEKKTFFVSIVRATNFVSTKMVYIMFRKNEKKIVFTVENLGRYETKT